MGFWEFVDDMKEKAEKREKIKEYRKRAKKYVEDGEKIYNRAYSEISSYSADTKYKIDQHYNYKQSLIKEISNEIKPVLVNFEKFNIDKRIIDISNSNISISSSLKGCDNFSHYSSTHVPVLILPKLIELFSDPEEEYWEAREQKNEAELFYEKMKYEKERLNNVKAQMKNIRCFIEDEKMMLDSLMAKTRKITAQLQIELTKNSFSQEQSEYLKGIHKIAVGIKDILEVKFLDDSLNITDEYQMAYKRVKEINTLLDNAPLINKGNSNLLDMLVIICEK